jgi:TRAP-type C4-dicarboxylate transport system substrate-binding protein
MKKVFLIPLIITLAVGLVFGGCGEPTTPTQPAPGAAPAEPIAPAAAPAEPITPIELSFASTLSLVSDMHKLCYEPWANKVMDQTQGKVNITIYPSSSLSMIQEMWASVTGGVADIGITGNTIEGRRLPLTSGFTSDARVPTGLPGLRIWEDLYDKFPEIRAEFQEVKILFPYTSTGPLVHTTKKQVRVPDDLKGMKIVGTGIWLEYIEYAGASPINLTPPEWYTSLDRGMAEGLFMECTAMEIFSTTELFKYHTDVHYGPAIMFVFMNLDVWNSLSPDIQRVFEDIKPWASEEFSKFTLAEKNKVMGKAQDLGHTIYQPTAEEIDLWDSVCGAPMTSKWMEETEALGKPAAEVYEEVVRLVGKYTK